MIPLLGGPGACDRPRAVMDWSSSFVLLQAREGTGSGCNDLPLLIVGVRQPLMIMVRDKPQAMDIMELSSLLLLEEYGQCGGAPEVDLRESRVVSGKVCQVAWSAPCESRTQKEE